MHRNACMHACTCHNLRMCCHIQYSMQQVAFNVITRSVHEKSLTAPCCYSVFARHVGPAAASIYTCMYVYINTCWTHLLFICKMLLLLLLLLLRYSCCSQRYPLGEAYVLLKMSALCVSSSLWCDLPDGHDLKHTRAVHVTLQALWRQIFQQTVTNKNWWSHGLVERQPSVQNAIAARLDKS